ncbi:uncharacterized protein DMAD_05957 [Drosophila madeirensis]|uniref:Uncharacterized protein n=1 Tax=Drosophila madeirensis TaxID=30013 RepID=A0AAU9FNM1_DROMD
MSCKPKNSVAAVKLAAKYCPNLQEPRFEYWDKVKPHLELLKEVDELRLKNDDTPIDLMNTLLELTKLTTLELYRFNREDIMPIKHLPQLQNLFIKNDCAVNLYELC